MILTGCLLSLMMYQAGPSFARETLSELVSRLEPQLRERAAAVRPLAVPLADPQFQQLVEAVVRQRVPVHAESEECRAHSQLVVDAVIRGETWALRMSDSSSGLPRGLLQGLMVNFGHFHECIGIREPNHLFKGQHCFVGTRDIIPRELHLHMNYDTSKFPKEVAEVLLHSKDLTVSVCVPSSCSARDVQAHMDRVLGPVNASSRVYDTYCSTDDTLPFALKDWFAIAVFSGIALAVCWATFADLQVGNDNYSALVSSFSLRRTWSQLTDTRAAEEVTSMAGVRVITTVTVLMVHVVTKDLWDQPVSLLALEQESWSFHWIELATRSLDVFFLLGGATRAYSFLRERARDKPFEIVPPILRRYVRYTPTLAAVALFSATLFIRCGSGPFWKSYLNFPVWGCCNLWFPSLLHITNFTYPPAPCVQHAWYLAVDFQLFIVSPLFLLLLHYKPPVGLLVLGVGIAASLLFHTLAAIAVEVDATTVSYLYRNRLNNEVKELIYINTLYRLSTYLLGIALGYFLFTSDQSKRRVTLSKTVLWLGWVASLLAVASVAFVSSIVLQPGYQRHSWVDVGYTVLAKPAAAAAVGWLVLVCHLGYGGLLNNFLSWRGFQPLSKLALGVYLVHYEVIRIQSSRVKSLTHYNIFQSLHVGMGVVMLSGLVAVVLYLCVEAPCSSLISFYLRKPINTAAVKDINYSSYSRLKQDFPNKKPLRRRQKRERT